MHIKGSQVEFSKSWCIAVRVDHDAVFHLGLKYLPKYRNFKHFISKLKVDRTENPVTRFTENLINIRNIHS